MKKRGLFLDFDGTLADSVLILEQVYVAFLKDFGIQGTESEFTTLNGPPLNLIVMHLKKTHKLPGSVDSLIDKYIQTMRGIYDLALPCKGAGELLKTAKKHEWAMAIVTSNSASLVEYWLKKNKLESFISVVIGMESVSEAKPAAEPYLKALNHLSCDAKTSFAVEDSQAGFQSARAAGIPTFLIQRGEKLERYNMAIESLDEVIPFLCR